MTEYRSDMLGTHRYIDLYCAFSFFANGSLIDSHTIEYVQVKHEGELNSWIYKVDIESDIFKAAVHAILREYDPKEVILELTDAAKWTQLESFRMMPW